MYDILPRFIFLHFFFFFVLLKCVHTHTLSAFSTNICRHYSVMLFASSQISLNIMYWIDIKSSMYSYMDVHIYVFTCIVSFYPLQIFLSDIFTFSKFGGCYFVPQQLWSQNYVKFMHICRQTNCLSRLHVIYLTWVVYVISVRKFRLYRL